jgi:hypothetical protein
MLEECFWDFFSQNLASQVILASLLELLWGELANLDGSKLSQIILLFSQIFIINKFKLEIGCTILSSYQH